jgi:hypothetical protein
MFRSKKINLDAARPRTRQRLKPKEIMSQGDSSVKVRAVPRRRGYSQREVPVEYRTLDHKKGGTWKFLFFLMILFIGTVAALYYWNNQTPPYTGGSVGIQASAPADVISGDAVTYLLEYVNNDVVALRSVELDVQWPDGFYYDSSSSNPLSDRATTWILGPLDPGQKKTLSITGQLVGLKGQTQRSIFRLSYRPANINSDFEETVTADIFISDAKVGLELKSENKVIAGQEIGLKVDLTNLTDFTLEGLDVEIIIPKDLDLISVEPELADNRWQGSIETNGSVTFNLVAKAVDGAIGDQSWVVIINEIVNEIPRRLLRKELALTAVRPDFAIDLKVNGQSSDFDIDYGKTLNYQAKLTNNSNGILNDIKVTALIDSDVIDRKFIQSTGRIVNDTIVWTKDNIEALGAMDPKEEVIISWKANLLEQGTIGRASVDNVITIELEGLADWDQKTPVFIIAVGEGLVFSQGLYWQLAGQKLGSGNLPPVTNESTQYFVVWSLDSGSQDYDTVTVSAFLPPQVSFVSVEEVDEGTLRFDEETSRLEWQINNFSNKLLPLKSSYYVKLVPTDEDAGEVITVLNPATVVASGKTVFQAKSYNLTTVQVITTEEGDVGTVVE